MVTGSSLRRTVEAPMVRTASMEVRVLTAKTAPMALMVPTVRREVQALTASLVPTAQRAPRGLAVLLDVFG